MQKYDSVPPSYLCRIPQKKSLTVSPYLEEALIGPSAVESAVLAVHNGGMKITALNQFNQLISWHKGFERHRISRPEFAPELLFSFFSAIVMMLVYYSWIILPFHILVLKGFFEHETISWAIIEISTRWVLLWLPDRFLGNQPVILGIFFAYIVLGLILRRVLSAGVANYHPKGPSSEE